MLNSRVSRGAAFCLILVGLGVRGNSAPQQQKIVWDFQDLCWSPDGKSIIFTGITEKNPRIYRVDAVRGSTPIAVFNKIDGNQGSPTWSPDGKSIAFHAYQEGRHTVYIGNADGSGIRKIADDAVTPSWSPDGRWIAYGARSNGKFQIYVMDPEGKSQRRITDNSAASFNPSWSPDSKFMVFESDRNHDDKDELYRIKADGTGEVLVKQDDENNLVYPSYSPDGRKIFYGAVANRNVDLYVMDADGQNARLWHKHAGSGHWSKKAGLLAFIAYDENKLRELFIAKPDGTGELAITSVNH